MNRRITLLAVFLCTMVAGVYAQSDDFGIWTSAEVKKKIFPGFDASVEGEFRTRDSNLCLLFVFYLLWKPDREEPKSERTE